MNNLNKFNIICDKSENFYSFKQFIDELSCLIQVKNCIHDIIFALREAHQFNMILNVNDVFEAFVYQVQLNNFVLYLRYKMFIILKN